MIRIGKPRKKCTMFESTLTIGSTSAGNSTFLSSPPPLISTLEDSINDTENHVHGSRPQNMNSAYGSVPGGWPPAWTTLNTKLYTSSSRSGLTNDQKKPSTDPR